MSVLWVKTLVANLITNVTDLTPLPHLLRRQRIRKCFLIALINLGSS